MLLKCIKLRKFIDIKALLSYYIESIYLLVFCVNKRISTKYYKNVSRMVLIMKKDDCIFCKLANGIIPTNSLYEDDIVNVIFDASPASEGHVLILPKEHFDNTEERVILKVKVKIDDLIGGNHKDFQFSRCIPLKVI